MSFALSNSNSVIQQLLHQADELTNLSFGLNSKVTIVGEQQYTTSNSFSLNENVLDINGPRLEEVDEATMNEILRSLPTTTNVYQQRQSIHESSPPGIVGDAPLSALTSNYSGELFQDPNPPQIIRRPAAQGPVTYRQNISVRFLQPPPVPPPGVSFCSKTSNSNIALIII
jgi:hypothetical protein